jgi:hypothetical protein
MAGSTPDPAGMFQPAILTVRHKQVLDTPSEEAGQCKGQGEAGVVPPGFHRIDRLPRYIEPFRYFRLRPASLQAEGTQVILHEQVPIRAKAGVLTLASLRTDRRAAGDRRTTG